MSTEEEHQNHWGGREGGSKEGNNGGGQWWRHIRGTLKHGVSGLRVTFLMGAIKLAMLLSTPGRIQDKELLGAK